MTAAQFNTPYRFNLGALFPNKVLIAYTGSLVISCSIIPKPSLQIFTGTYITVDLMCGKDYLTGVGGMGFAPGVLQRIGQVADVLNLMTYELHNIYSDYRPDGSGRTGLSTNLFPQPGAPSE